MSTVYVNGPQIAYDYEQITVAATAIGVTESKRVKTVTTNIQTDGTCYTSTYTAIEVILLLETAQIRWTCDGTTPTTTVGNPMDAGDSIVISGAQNIKQFRAIRTGGTSGSLNVTFLKQ